MIIIETNQKTGEKRELTYREMLSITRKLALKNKIPLDHVVKMFGWGDSFNNIDYSYKKKESNSESKMHLKLFQIKKLSSGKISILVTLKDSEDKLVISATLDYVMQAVKERLYNVVNYPEFLIELNQNIQSL